jgi:hypothetical protein
MHIGYVEFIDGQTRALFADEDGGQDVLGGDCQPVYGVWIGPQFDGADPSIIRASMTSQQYEATHGAFLGSRNQRSLWHVIPARRITRPSSLPMLPSPGKSSFGI